LIATETSLGDRLILFHRLTRFHRFHHCDKPRLLPRVSTAAAVNPETLETSPETLPDHPSFPDIIPIPNCHIRRAQLLLAFNQKLHPAATEKPRIFPTSTPKLPLSHRNIQKRYNPLLASNTGGVTNPYIVRDI
jgi:hypothetical protein